jgi:BCD family chlorophyll transporter-like MFS transporter
MGTLLQFGGFAIMPFALLVLAGAGASADAPAWIGQLAAGLAFFLVGAGIHTTQTVGLALATDQAPVASQPKVVGLMYVMLLIGMLVSAFVFGELLTDYSPGRLIQVIQGVAVTTLILNTVAMWKQEARSRNRKPGADRHDPSFAEAWALFRQGEHALRRLWLIGLGTMAFAMEDVLIEPYGGEILGLSVSTTTSLTATLALGGLIGFGYASRVLTRGADPMRIAGLGSLVGLPAFGLVMLAAPMQSTALFSAGILLIGAGGGLFGHGTLTATMNRAQPGQEGIALGAWGAVQASAAGLAMAMGGLLRDLIAAFSGPLPGYLGVYAIEFGMLLACLAVLPPLLRPRPPSVPSV